MLEVKTYPLTIALYKHAPEDAKQIVFVSGYPHAHDIFMFEQGKTGSEDMRKVVADLAVTFGVQLTISEIPVNKESGE